MTVIIEANPKAPKFKVNDRVRIPKHKSILSKGYTLTKGNIFYRKTNPCTYKLKDLNRAKIIGSFDEKHLC